MNNLKTTVAGVATLMAAVVAVYLGWYHNTAIDWTVVSAEVTGGVGLLTARDSKKTDLSPTEQKTVKDAVVTGQITPTAK